MGILAGIILVLPAVFVLGALPRTQVTEDIFINPLDVLVLILLPLFLILLTFKKIHWPKNSISKSALIFIIILLLTLVLNASKHTEDEILVGFLYWLRFTSYMLILIIIPQMSQKIKKWYETILTVASILIITIGFTQYLFYPNLRNLYYLGWDEHLYRLFSSFLDPNFAGVIIVLSIHLFIEKWRRDKQNIWIVSTVAGIVALFLTYSRTAYAAFAVSGLWYIKYIKQKILVLTALSIAAGLLLIIPNIQGGEGVNILRTYSINERISQMQEGILHFQNNPIFGVGFNMYGHHNNLEQTQYPSNADSGIPNSYIFTLATSGIVGAASLIYFYATIIREGIRQKRVVVVTSTATVLVGALFENTLYYNYILFLYFSIIALYAQNETIQKK